MTKLRTAAATTALTCLVAVPTAFAATTSTSQSPSTSSTSAQPSTSTSPSSSASGAAGVHVENPITLRLDAKKHIDTSALPDEGTLFTEGELAGVIPHLQSVERTDDTLTLVLAGETDADRSKLVINLVRFGTKEDLSKKWATEKAAHEVRAAKNTGLYTFFGPGSHHVADSFSDGTTTHVLLTHGDAAGEIWFSGIGFESLGDSHAAARRAYRERVVPAIVDLLGAKVDQGGRTNDGDSHGAASGSPSATPSASSSSTTTTK